MSDKRIIYPTPEGGVAVIVPAPNCGLTIDQIALKDVPSGVPFDIVDVSEVPSDRTFRGAWKKQGAVIQHDMEKAKLIAHDMRRAARAKEFAPFDEIISKQIPGKDVVVAEASRQAIRSKYDDMQVSINNTNTIDSLLQIVK